MILEAGSPTAAQDSQGQTALHYFLQSRFSCSTGECAVKTTIMLIQGRVPVNTANNEGLTSLDILREKKATFPSDHLLEIVADFASRTETA